MTFSRALPGASRRTIPGAVVSRLLAVLLLAVAPAAAVHVRPAEAATPLTVSYAISHQSGTGTVRGYVVGQPTATSTVVRSGFPNDYAMALADSAGETSTSRMIYVQIPSGFRAQWGLHSHPELMGQQLDVTGTLASYFAHPGLTSSTAFAKAGGSGGGGDTDGYYAGTDGLSGQALETRLHQIISTGVTTLSYDEVWTALEDTDQDPANSNNVVEVYSGRSIAKADHGGGVDQWNREHVWAKSHGDFGTVAGPGTDVHHLRPEDVTVNADRGNLDFDEGGTPDAEAPSNSYDSDSWEPRDAVKGDVARMIFYMSVRWDGGDGFPDLEVNDLTGNGTTPHIGKLSTLLRWNDQDPPDAFEQRRNERIYAVWQHNRNPFVDHPEWADAIW